jgi:hypothetical protein
MPSLVRGELMACRTCQDRGEPDDITSATPYEGPWYHLDSFGKRVYKDHIVWPVRVEPPPAPSIEEQDRLEKVHRDDLAFREVLAHAAHPENCGPDCENTYCIVDDFWTPEEELA